MRAILATAIIFSILAINSTFAQASSSRYFNHGNGTIHLRSPKTGASFSGKYRNDDGSYDEAALKKIHQVFAAKFKPGTPTISPRLIEYLDFIEDRTNEGARISIVSGYRSPTYNTGLRKKGRLAARASLHQYGMAADISIDGVNSKTIWEFVKEYRFGGAGYYQGKLVHIDVGPARSWTQTTSGVGTGISNYNKLICIVADRDIYYPGEAIGIRFTRMTAFPIGVDPTFVLERRVGRKKWRKVTAFTPNFSKKHNGECPQFNDIEEMSDIKWRLPMQLRKGRYRIKASFCNKEWEKMPESIVTPEFEIRKQ
jgi:uncharacterized protein YcbK (DUF882 family)